MRAPILTPQAGQHPSIHSIMMSISRTKRGVGKPGPGSSDRRRFLRPDGGLRKGRGARLFQDVASLVRQLFGKCRQKKMNFLISWIFPHFLNCRNSSLPPPPSLIGLHCTKKKRGASNRRGLSLRGLSLTLGLSVAARLACLVRQRERIRVCHMSSHSSPFANTLLHRQSTPPSNTPSSSISEFATWGAICTND